MKTDIQKHRDKQKTLKRKRKDYYLTDDEHHALRTVLRELRKKEG